MEAHLFEREKRAIYSAVISVDKVNNSLFSGKILSTAPEQPLTLSKVCDSSVKGKLAFHSEYFIQVLRVSQCFVTVTSNWSKYSCVRVKCFAFLLPE